MQHSYKIVKEAEDKDQTIIEKGGITATFTIQDMKNEQLHIEKMLKELKAKEQIEQVKFDNYLNHCPELKTMDEELILRAHLFFESKAFLNQIPKKVKELEEQLEMSKAEEGLVRVMVFGPTEINVAE